MAATAKTLQQAVRAHQSGNLQQAEQLYRRILRVDPYQADALHLLGVVAHQQGDQANAVEHIRQAIAINPRNPIYLGNLGAAYRALGRLDDAAETCQQAVQIDPQYAGAHFNLGLVLMGQGNALGARRRFEQAVRLKPDLTEAWNSLGNACEKLGDHFEAIAAYHEALKQNPEFVNAHYNLGNAFLAAGRLAEAVEAYSQALQRRPEFPDALNNLGTALRLMGHFQQAIASFGIALRLQPDFPEACNNLGAAHMSLGRLDEAEHWYREALSLQPKNAAAHNNLGTVFNSRGQLDQAIASFREASQLDPSDPEAPGNLGGALQMQGRVNEADVAYARALNLSPQHHRLRIQRALMLPPVYDSIEDLHEWRERFSTRLTQLHADGVTLDASRDLLPVTFYLAYQGFDDRSLAESVARLYRASEQPRLRARPAGKKRIGFLSKYFHNHTVGTLTLGLIEELPRRDFEVVVLSLGEHEDALAQRIRAAAGQFVVVADQVAPAISQIAELGLDVLFFPDVGMDPLSYTLGHSRLAPRQCVTWGHPVTTGLPTMDAFLSSELLEIPGAESQYTEQLVRLKTLPVYYHRPALPAGPRPREAFGLPSEGSLYLCPQSLFKLHPEFDAMLREILERDPRGRLALIEAPQAFWTEKLTSRLRRTLGSAFDRVHVLPRQGHLDFLSLMLAADVILDPLHFGGGNTTYQGLACGTPIVTLPSEFLRGRVTLGCYRKMGLEHFASSTREDYIQTALRLATDADWNAEVRRRIHDASPALFEDRQAVREFSEFFRAA